MAAVPSRREGGGGHNQAACAHPPLLSVRADCYKMQFMLKTVGAGTMSRRITVHTQVCCPKLDSCGY
jgi:hypothetical protein